MLWRARLTSLLGSIVDGVEAAVIGSKMPNRRTKHRKSGHLVTRKTVEAWQSHHLKDLLGWIFQRSQAIALDPKRQIPWRNCWIANRQLVVTTSTSIFGRSSCIPPLHHGFQIDTRTYFSYSSHFIAVFLEVLLPHWQLIPTTFNKTSTVSAEVHMPMNVRMTCFHLILNVRQKHRKSLGSQCPVSLKSMPVSWKVWEPSNSNEFALYQHKCKPTSSRWEVVRKSQIYSDAKRPLDMSKSAISRPTS